MAGFLLPGNLPLLLDVGGQVAGVIVQSGGGGRHGVHVVGDAGLLGREMVGGQGATEVGYGGFQERVRMERIDPVGDLDLAEGVVKVCWGLCCHDGNCGKKFFGWDFCGGGGSGGRCVADVNTFGEFWG